MISATPESLRCSIRECRAVRKPSSRILEAGLQAITDAGFGNEQTRIIGISLDFLPQLAHQNPQILDVFPLVPGPDILQQLVVRDHESDMRSQNVHEPIFFSSQPYLFLVERDRPT